MLRGRALVALVCMLAATALSGVLLLEHHGIAGPVAAALCGDASGSPTGLGAEPPAGLATGSTPVASRPTGCEEVARSPYSTVQGVPLAAFGLAFSAALCGLLALAVAVSEDARRGLLAAALLALGLALVVDVMLFGVQVFAIGRFCALCLATYVTNAIAFAALLPARSGATSVTTALAAPEGRVALAGVAVAATLALGLTALTDRGLAAAASKREATLLGAPGSVAASPVAVPPTSPLAAAPAPAEPAAAPGSDLAAARAEVTRLRGILADPQKLQDYLERQARDDFERTRPEDVDLRETPIKGPEAAPIKVVEYSDFLCPYCKAIAGAFANYLPSSGNRVAIHFKHYPLDKDCNPKLTQTIHPGACTLALGGVCAQEQGKFWPYHDRVFAAAPPNASRDDVVRIAVGAGLEPTPFGACLDSPKAKQRLAADIAEAERLKVNSTPTLFVNGKRLANINLFLQAVESESHRLGLPPPAGAAGPR